MKKLMKLVAIILVALVAVSFTACKKSETTLHIGICQLVQHNALDQATQGFIDALQEACDAKGVKVEFDKQNAQGDSNTCVTIVNSFVTKKYDLILANATAALQAAYNGTTTIPVLGTSITEYSVALGLKDYNGTVGGNVSGTSDLAPLTEQAQMMLDLLPNAQTFGLIYCSAEANSLYQVNAVKSYLESKGKTATLYSFTDSNDISTVVTNAVAACDALYVPTDNTAAANAQLIDSIARPAKCPIFAGEESICEGCGFATLSISYYSLGQTTGKMAARILLEGADISKMPVEYDSNPVKKYNKAICEELGITIPADYVAIED